MTWLLGKLGLSLLDGKTLLPIAGVLAAAAALLASGLYAIHHLTAQGYEKAILECNARDAAANDEKRDLQASLREKSRDVIIRHTADAAKATAAVANETREVTDDIENNPAPAGCALTAVGLRIWNRALIEDGVIGLSGGFGAAGQDRSSASELATGASGRPGFVAGKPDRLETGLRGSGAGLEVTIGTGEAVPAAAGERAAVGAR